MRAGMSPKEILLHMIYEHFVRGFSKLVLGCGPVLNQMRYGTLTANRTDKNGTGEVLVVQNYNVSLSLLLINENNYALSFSCVGIWKAMLWICLGEVKGHSFDYATYSYCMFNV